MKLTSIESELVELEEENKNDKKLKQALIKEIENEKN